MTGLKEARVIEVASEGSHIRGEVSYRHRPEDFVLLVSGVGSKRKRETIEGY